MLLEGSVEVNLVQGALVVDTPEEVLVLGQAQTGEFRQDFIALLQDELGHLAHFRQGVGIDVLVRTLPSARRQRLTVHGGLHGETQGTLLIVLTEFPDHAAQHVAGHGKFHLGVHGLDILIAGVHLAQGIGKVGNLGHIVPHTVVLALYAFSVTDVLEEDILKVPVVHGCGIDGIAALIFVAVAVAVERHAEVHHLVRDALLAMEDVVNGLGASTVAGNGAAVQRRIVVRRITLVIGHDVDVVHVRQHIDVVCIFSAGRGCVGEDLVRHGFAHLLEQGDEILPVGRGGAVYMVAVFGGIGGILPVNVEAVYVVLLADSHAPVNERLALFEVSGHLGPAVGILSPAAHLHLYLELGVTVVLIVHELLHQGEGPGRNIDTRTIVLILETHMTHVHMSDGALHVLQGREPVGLGVLRVVDFDDGSNADTGQTRRVVHNLVDDGIDGSGARSGSGGIRVEGISLGNGTHIGLGTRIGHHHTGKGLIRRARIQEADYSSQQCHSKNSRCFHLDTF